MGTIFDTPMITDLDQLTVADLKIRARLLHKLAAAHEDFYRAVLEKDVNKAEKCLEHRTMLLDTASHVARNRQK